MRGRGLRRLVALERRLRNDQLAAEKQAFVDIGALVALAHYVGGARSFEEMPAGLAKALEYRDIDGLCSTLAGAINGRTGVLYQRGDDAWRRLFDLFGLNFDRCSPTAVRAELRKIVSSLPARLVKEIKAAATAQAQDKLTETNVNRWYDETERAVEAGQMSPAEAAEKLFTGSDLRKFHVFTRAMLDAADD